MKIALDIALPTGVTAVHLTYRVGDAKPWEAYVHHVTPAGPRCVLMRGTDARAALQMAVFKATYAMTQPVCPLAEAEFGPAFSLAA